MISLMIVLKMMSWYWGLGDDGNLYCRGSYYSDRWRLFNYGLGWDLTIKDMKKIVKQFGDLLPFL